MRISRLSSLLSAAVVFGNGILAAPAQHDHEARQSHPRVVTTGVQGSGIQPRLEIHQLMNIPDQWNLYILAMRRFMDRDNSDPLGKSFYAVAGIHGVPHAMWGGLKACDTCFKTNPPAYGYCTHLSVLFPGWHRAYLAFTEQIVVENAISVANEYPAASRARMLDAARRLRLPFSDWAAHKPTSEQTTLPGVFLQPQITVDGPNGRVTVDNPLHSYTFNDPLTTAVGYPYYGQWKKTLRWPTSDAPNAQSRDEQAAYSMNVLQGSLQEQIFNLLSNCPNYQSFSNANGGSSQCSNSIERTHSAIHAAIGGASPTPGKSFGHMISLPFSAFEPYFMIHHCTVDRYIALWQTLNPSSWGASQPTGYSSVTYPLGAVQDGNSDLTPFFKDNSGKFWTLNEVRNWTIFNYQYPEYLATDGSRAAIASLVAAYYGPNAKLTAGSVPVPPQKKAPAPRPPNPSPARSAPPAKNTTLQDAPPAPAPAPSQGQSSTPPVPAPQPAQDQQQSGPPVPASQPSQGQPASTSPAPASQSPQGQQPSTYTAPAPANPPFPSSNATQPCPSESAPSWLMPGMDIPGLTDWLQANANDAGKTQGQYVANIVCDASALGGRFMVYVFGDAPTEQPESYTQDKNFLGYVAMVAHFNVSTGFKTYGAVPLSFYVLRMVNEGKLPNTDESVVLPWLKEHLQWRIVNSEGQCVPPEDVEGFSLSVYSSTSEVLAPYDLPRWAPVQPQLDVTKDQPGGAAEVPQFVTNIVHGLLGQPGGGADSIGAEIAQVVGAPLKDASKKILGII